MLFHGGLYFCHQQGWLTDPLSRAWHCFFRAVPDGMLRVPGLLSEGYVLRPLPGDWNRSADLRRVYHDLRLGADFDVFIFSAMK